MKYRKKRKGEYTCNCSAYRFPHRFGGGRCMGVVVADETWDETHGIGSPCDQCNSRYEGEYGYGCDVVDRRESPTCCDAVQEFARLYEIKLV